MHSFRSFEHLCYLNVEINKGQVIKAKDIYLELAMAKKSATTTCVLADSKAGQRVRKLYSGEKGFRYTLFGDCWPRETGGRQAGSGAVTVSV